MSGEHSSFTGVLIVPRCYSLTSTPKLPLRYKGTRSTQLIAGITLESLCCRRAVIFCKSLVDIISCKGQAQLQESPQSEKLELWSPIKYIVHSQPSHLDAIYKSVFIFTISNVAWCLLILFLQLVKLILEEEERVTYWLPPRNIILQYRWQQRR